MDPGLSRCNSNLKMVIFHCYVSLPEFHLWKNKGSSHMRLPDWKVNLIPILVDFYGFHTGQYTSPMDAISKLNELRKFWCPGLFSGCQDWGFSLISQWNSPTHYDLLHNIPSWNAVLLNSYLPWWIVWGTLQGRVVTFLDLSRGLVFFSNRAPHAKGTHWQVFWPSTAV